jgi:tripartite-type tricarboxylate transporter receptor subunit TctC
MSHNTLKTILGAVGFCVVTAVQAAYPERPITLVVTYPPGGTADRVARLVAPELAKELGQNVVVDNRGGAGGMIGAAYVAKAPADGYTIMLDAANHVQNPALRASMQFDTLKDFASVMLLQRVPNVLVANPGFAPKTVAELIALTKPKTSVVHYGTSGAGSAQHLAGAITDVLSGQVPLAFATVGTILPHVKSGKLRVLASGGEKRSEVLPDVPTMIESGVAGYSSYEWNAIFAPAATPAAVITRLNQALANVMKQPSVITGIAAFSGEIIASSPQELESFRRAEISKWQRVAKEYNIKLDQ